MISIITAIHNQRAVNELFWEYLQRYTQQPFELIIIDNASTDGSAEFFESVGARVIRNPLNYSYPYSQNQGIAIAKYDWLVFMNNDVLVSPQWDKNIVESMQHHGLEVASVCGIEKLESECVTRRFKRRWQRIKNFLSLFGRSKRTLLLMHRWMYGDWEKFCEQRRQQFFRKLQIGVVGNTVVLQRSALAKVGPWDERIQSADFDLYLRTEKRALEVGDIKPMHICLDSFVHHYIRLTSKTPYPPFADRENLIRMTQKWSPEDLKLLEKIDIICDDRA